MKIKLFIHHFTTTLNVIIRSWFLCASILALFSLEAKSQVFFQNAVVKIEAESPKTLGQAEKDCGTGFIICIDRLAYILTAKHVIENQYSKLAHTQINTTFFGVSGYFPEVFRRKSDRDIAVLELTKPPKNALALNNSTFQFPRLNDEVFVVGYPGCGKLEVSNGYISKLDSERIYVKGIKVDHGFSGAPLIHKESKKVIGMFIEMIPNSDEQSALSIPFIKSQIPEICNPCYPERPCTWIPDESEREKLIQAYLLSGAHFCKMSLKLFRELWDSIDNQNCLKLTNPDPFISDKICSLKVKAAKNIFNGCYQAYSKD